MSSGLMEVGRFVKRKLVSADFGAERVFFDLKGLSTPIKDLAGNKKEFQGLALLEAFSKVTDTEQCPIAHCYKAGEFMALCQSAGFEQVSYEGDYLSVWELQSLYNYGEAALEDERLAAEQKQFLRALTYDARATQVCRHRRGVSLEKSLSQPRPVSN